MMLKITDVMPAAVLNVPTRRRENFPEIDDPLFWELYERCAAFSMVHIPGFFNVYQTVRYIERQRLPGDFVECGCYLGGIGAFVALLCRRIGLERRIVLFDTYEGFPVGQEDALVGHKGTILGHSYGNILAHVKDNIEHVAPANGMVSYVEGDVAQTIPTSDVTAISMLRLDTDFYVSTKVELDHFYPKLVPRGVLIIDDYGTYQGSRRATEEFVANLEMPPLLNRIDMSVWAGIKP